MQHAISLAEKGTGFVSPNPLVGAVIVKDNKIIGEGYHEKFGELHAERNAFKNCTESPIGATMYVTLEPCCHYGKTPPCTEAIIENGISKVFVSMLDPNPLVAGKGIEILKNAGIEVSVGLLSEESKKQNEVFLHYIKNKTPFVVLKYAMTLDGKIATVTGKSKWITNEQSREYVHKLRNKYSGILVGVDTVIADNPMLDCRLDNTQNPIRIICDTNLRTPINSNIVNSAKNIKTIIATNQENDISKQPYIEKGIEFLTINKKDNHLDLENLINQLGILGIDSILVEGGGNINFSMLQSNLANKIYSFIAPKIFGGSNAKTPVSGVGFKAVNNNVKIKTLDIKTFGYDILIESEVHYSYLQE